MDRIPRDVLADRLFELLRERCGTRGQCSAGWCDLVWSLADRWPDELRPRLFEVADALNALRRARRIETTIDPNGVRTCFLTEYHP